MIKVHCNEAFPIRKDVYGVVCYASSPIEEGDVISVRQDSKENLAFVRKVIRYASSSEYLTYGLHISWMKDASDIDTS